jgi:hypothetical protein
MLQARTFKLMVGGAPGSNIGKIEAGGKSRRVREAAFEPPMFHWSHFLGTYEQNSSYRLIAS